jgi:hypothetical protein
MRRTTLDPDGLSAACEVLWPTLRDASVDGLEAYPRRRSTVAGLMPRPNQTISRSAVFGASAARTTVPTPDRRLPRRSRIAAIDDVSHAADDLRAVDAACGGAAGVAALVDRGEAAEISEQAGIPLFAHLVDEILAAARGDLITGRRCPR